MESPALGSTHCVRMAPGACGSEWLGLAHFCNRLLKSRGIKCPNPFPYAGRPRLPLEYLPLSTSISRRNDVLLPRHEEPRLYSGNDLPPQRSKSPADGDVYPNSESLSFGLHVRSMIVTGQLTISGWYEMIGNLTAANSILYRLVHNTRPIPATQVH